MSKKYRIKWRDSDEQEVKRVVRNFNAKLARLEKKNPELYKNTLPTFYDRETDTYTKRLSVRQFKELVETRQDLKRELNSLKRFARRGAEEIVVIPDTQYNIKTTKWQKREMNIMTGILNRKRSKRLNEIRSSLVEGQDYTLGELNMGSTGENELKPFKPFYWSMKQSDVNRRYGSLRRQTQTEYYTKRDFDLKHNYIESLERYYAPDDIADVVQAVKDADMDTFLKNFRSVDLNTFEWASDVPSQDDPRYQGYVQHMKSEWLKNR